MCHKQEELNKKEEIINKIQYEQTKRKIKYYEDENTIKTNNSNIEIISVLTLGEDQRRKVQEDKISST